MGFFSGAIVPNITSQAEAARYGNSALIFPAENSVQSEIPLYLKFSCVEYSMGQLARSGGYGTGGGGNLKAQIFVPAPSRLVTQTAMRYKQEENEEFMKFQEQKDLESSLEKMQAKLDDIPLPIPGRAGLYFKEFGKRLAKTYSSMIDTDFTETVLQSGSKRSFTISMYMPCLNVADSLAAAQITQAFEALSLPTIIGASVLGVFGAQIQFHPPMWNFGIGTLLGANTDMDWTSQPQMSVLTNVAVSRTAIDATSFTALEGNVKPVAYSVTLNFQEIEGAYRATAAPNSPTSFTITNRSGAVGKYSAGRATIEALVKAAGI